jgi:hypothetical protein
VAGFAAANVMLISVSVWAGYVEDMSATTRHLLHWFSALIALPAIVYAGRPFYRSALAALAARRTNMDVPISLAVLLAAGMSLFETMEGGRYVYFDSAVALLFFLLLGRYLDCRARGRARAAVERLLSLTATSVTVVETDGRRRVTTPDRLRPGMTLLAAAGERIAADGRVTAGRSELDTSLITGESLPRPVAGGDPVFAGTLNLGAPLTVAVTAVGEGTLLAHGERRAAPRPLRGAGRPHLPLLRPGGPRPGSGDLPRLDLPGRRALAAGPAPRRRGADHHLPLRPRPGGAGGPGDRQRPTAAPRRAAEVRDRSGAPRAGRHGGLRQDRHAHPRPAEPRLRGTRPRGAPPRHLPGRGEPPSPGAGAEHGRAGRAGAGGGAGGARPWRGR